MSTSFSSQQEKQQQTNSKSATTATAANRLSPQCRVSFADNSQQQTPTNKRSFSSFSTNTTYNNSIEEAPLPVTTPQKMKAQEESLCSLISTANYEKLSYTICDHSSHSGSYHPRNICVNDPTEQSSRWSSGSHDQSQYITIKLDKPAVACEIVFGKFHRSHVCNLKEFKVFGGLEPQEMNEILHKGLTDDNKPETFSIRYTYHDLIFPVQYIKIAPLATFGANFNYSIWYVEIKGIEDEGLMSRVYDAYNDYKEMETIRLCLKHFRQKNMMDVYQTLLSNTGIELEHPMIGKLHQALVTEGNFELAQDIILEANKEKNLFESFVQEAKYVPSWFKISASNDDGDAPCARGGHQLCIDSEREKIYLLGGWDGKRELSDFWCYHIKENRWRLLSSDTTLQDGPSARSCHTMCFDPTRKSIYLLGRYVEFRPSTTPDATLYESEFYQYFIELDRWVKISENTQIDGGPALLCDHQMCVDPVGRRLYVFGGRILTADSLPAAYSGLYAYDMDLNTWTLLRYDINHVPSAAQLLQTPTSPNTTHLTVSEPPISRRRSSNGSYVPSPSPSQSIKARAGHSMLMDPKNQKIYIFAGQRAKECLTDLYCYYILDDRVIEIAQDFSKKIGAESAGYTQRATIDLERQEIYISSGFLKSKPTKVVRNCFWVYHIVQNTWEQVYESDNLDTAYWQRMKELEPVPRYTHQFVYNPKSKSHFIFGGHPGDSTQDDKRLDDFWELKLAKPDTAQVVRRCLYLIRTRKLFELCREADIKFNVKGQPLHRSEISHDTLKALEYLRRYVTPLVNHESKEEVQHFKYLCSHLCLLEDTSKVKKSGVDLYYSTPSSKKDNYFTDRTKVFQALLEYFPDNMKEPNRSLVDAVKVG